MNAGNAASVRIKHCQIQSVARSARTKTNEPIRNWKFVYNRLVGTVGEDDQAKEIRTSPIQWVDGDTVGTLNSTYILGECDPEMSREDWIVYLNHW